MARFKNVGDFKQQMYGESNDYEDVIYSDFWKDCYSQFDNRKGETYEKIRR